MSNRRMFAKSIVDTDDFLDMPVSARLLYYDLGMRADDDGFVSPKGVMRNTGSSDDDLKVLLAKKFVLNCDNKILVIRDWKINNLIRSDRYTPTIYQEYLKKLQIADNNQYQLPTGIPLDIPLGNPISIGKDSKGKESIGDIASPSAPLAIFNFKEEIQKLKQSPQRHIQIIGNFLEDLKSPLENSAQMKAAIKRHLRAAKSLSDFSDIQIERAAKEAEKQYPNMWVLETLIKILTK